MIYTCSVCRYTFQGTGDTDCCPDCGKDFIRKATPSEVREYFSFRREYPPDEQVKKTAV